MRGESPISLPSPYQGLQDCYYRRTVHTTTVILRQVRHPSSPQLLRNGYLKIWVGGASQKNWWGGWGRWGVNRLLLCLPHTRASKTGITAVHYPPPRII
jgi:hypothetical protein